MSNETETARTKRRPVVLVIEDESPCLCSVINALTREAAARGIAVDILAVPTARDAERSWSKWTEHGLTPDIILMDGSYYFNGEYEDNGTSISYLRDIKKYEGPIVAMSSAAMSNMELQHYGATHNISRVHPHDDRRLDKTEAAEIAISILSDGS